jgi:DNA-binding transcriptional LysR family regulator
VSQHVAAGQARGTSRRADQPRRDHLHAGRRAILLYDHAGASTQQLREAVNHDMGLAVALEWVFSPELKSGKVVEILQDSALPKAAVHQNADAG